MVRAAITFTALLIGVCVDAHAQADFAVTPDVTAVADANNQFTLDLYNSVRDTPGNLFLSPYSVSTALAMLHAGAVGPTAAEIGRTLHLPDLSPTELRHTLGDLIRYFQADKSSSGYELHVANAAWTGNDVPINKDYLNLVEQDFSAHIGNVEFRRPESAAKTINDWVADHTAGKIKDLIPASAITSDEQRQAALVLTNAIYFKGDWKLQFKTEDTHNDDWHTLSGNTSSVAMMHQRGEFSFIENDRLSAIELPYIREDVSMIALLPAANDGLPELEKMLDAEHLNTIIDDLEAHNSEVQVSFPKYKIESGFELTKQLQQLGLNTAFTKTADFTKITGQLQMLVTNVFHKAWVKVDEQGTEAAAATGIVGFHPDVVRTPEVFNADHPFLFLIRDVKTKTILFIGRIEKPEV